jgi:hypothetical protein
VVRWAGRRGWLANGEGGREPKEMKADGQAWPDDGVEEEESRGGR